MALAAGGAMTRLGQVLMIAGFALVLSGCGGSSTGPSPFTQTISGNVSGGLGANRHPIGIPQSGNMTLTLTWSNPNVDLDLELTSSSCAVLTISCPVFGVSSSN